MTIPEPQFDDLFREVILDHYRRPRNHGALDAPTVTVEGMNPVCGDEVRLDLAVSGDAISDIAFGGQGCSISLASTSMLTEAVKGRSLSDADGIGERFRAMMMDEAEPGRDFGDLEALQGVAKFPVRVKCALLGWNVLRQGLEQVRAEAR
ncbi:MAG: SUF system NifU family Fe-S cluster assembly protein [Dehalococcoidia bacterium]